MHLGNIRQEENRIAAARKKRNARSEDDAGGEGEGPGTRRNYKHTCSKKNPKRDSTYKKRARKAHYS